MNGRYLAFCCALASSLLGAGPSEYIALFDATIRIQNSGELLITERIDYVLGDAILKHGIVREFPTEYQGPSGTNYSVLFLVKSVVRDGEQEPYKMLSTHGGKLLRMGSEDRFLTPGRHQYVITYLTSRQLLFDDPRWDELFWNVTGLKTRWPILKARATFILPDALSVKQISLSGYTGPFGAQGKSYTFFGTGEKTLVVETTAPLGPFEGLSVSLTWQKGIIQRPSRLQEIWWFVCDNPGLTLFFFVFLGLLIFYILVWRRVRATQTVGPVIPLFYPPATILPSGGRYLLHMGYDSRQLAAELVSLAVKGFIKIEFEPGWLSKGTYTIVRVAETEESAPRVPTEEIYKDMLARLFSASNTVQLSQQGRGYVAAAADSLRSSLWKQFKPYFDFQVRYGVIGGVASAVTTLLALLLDGWLNPLVPIMLFGLVALFIFLLRSYTYEGCKLRDEIKGFKMFLLAAETERLDIIGTPPVRTPELYETYLPYAIALDAERQWTRQFAPVFKHLEEVGNPYMPTWYAGRILTYAALDAFASDLSSFASDVNIPLPTSKTSSGGGGGGFSGGGRGGGGVDSW
ncbi:MAG: hypothetical protein UV38_C0002G0112 [candidate division TM6 bacterium GW2011_GWE2_42_60]|nr:MAG: hypothetical protein UV38_C0002G0112 [candidate division TM6 bacterium GW2011_GWE2_42_60]HBY06129.1 hypothetical protein [Candidatus Dependentiae bacterium]